MMKKLLLSLLCVLTALAVNAQTPAVTPPAGSFSVTGDVLYKGLGSVTINVAGAEINRDCAGYVSLDKDGVRMVDVPASNERRVYLDKETGEIRIDFWTGTLVDSPYAYMGAYRMVVPAGLYSVAGEPNKAFMVNWEILDNPQTAKIVSVPANLSSVETLSTVTLTFEGASNVTLAKASGVYVPDPYFVSSGVDGGDTVDPSDIKPSISISGNVATLTFAEPFEKACNVALNIEDGAFKSNDQAIAGTIINIGVIGKSEVKPDENGFAFTPAPGTFEGGLPSIKVTDDWSATIYNNSEAYCNIILQMPEGAQITSVTGMMTTSRPYIADGSKTKLTAYSVKYTQNKAKDAVFFGNSQYVDGAAAYTQDIPWSMPAGQYYFILPAGAIKYVMPDDPNTTLSTPDLVYGPFTVTAAAVKYDITPEVGSTLEELPDVTVTFDGTAVSLESIYNRYATIKNGTVVYDVLVDCTGNTVTVKGGLNAPGEYTIEIPGLMVDGALVNVEPLTYTVESSTVSGVAFVANDELITAKFVNDDETYGYFANVVIPKGSAMQVAVELPVGFDSVYYKENGSDIATEVPGEGDDDIVALSIPEEDLVAAGFQKAAGNKLTVKLGANDLAIAYGANGKLTDPAPLMITAYAPLPVREMNPAADAEVPSFPEVSSVYVGFATGGDNGIALEYDETLKVIVTKDGADFASYPVVKDSPNVYVNRNYNERLYINFGKALDPGVYSVNIPSGFISGTIAGESSIEGSAGLNEYVEYSFKVVKAFEYSFAPAAGELVASELATIKITYPEGTTVTLVEAEATEESAEAAEGEEGEEEEKVYTQPTLEFVDPSYTDEEGNPSEMHTVLTEYNVSAEGNVVTLTAVTPEGITSFTDAISRKWDLVNVPAGLWSVSDGTDSALNPQLTLGNYAVRAFGPGMFTFEPALDTPGLKMADLKEITLVLPDDVEYNTAKSTVFKPNGASAVFMLYSLPKSTTFSYTYTCKEISEDGKRITVKMKDNTSPTSAANNVDVCQVGPTQIEFAKDLFVKGEEKNAALVVPAYNVDGVDYVSIMNSTPANYGVVDAGIASLSLTMLRASYVCEPDAEITLSKNGVVIASVKAGDTTTANAKDSSKAGSTSIAYSNLFKKADGTNWTEPGKYIFNIPAGIFRQKDSEFKNNAREIEVFVAKEYKNYTVSPAPATFEGTTAATLVCTPNNNEIEYTELLITFPEAKSVKLNPNYKNILSNAMVGTATAANIAKGAITVTGVTGYSFGGAEVVGDNAVKLILSQPYRKATAADKYVAFQIPAALYLVDVENDGEVETMPNTKFTLWYQPLDTYPLEAYSTSFDKPVASEDLEAITMYASETMYNQSSVTPVLKNEEGVVVANYVGAAPAEKAGLNNNYIVFSFRAPADGADENLVKSITDLPNGKYTFEIAAESLTGGSASSASLITHNAKAMTYELDVYKPESLADHSKLSIPSALECNRTTASSMLGKGMMIVSLGLASKNIEVNAACEETVDMYYNGTLLKSIPTTVTEENTGVMIMSVGALAEGDENELLDFPAVNELYMVFTMNPYDEAYRQNGEYRVVIPNGALLKEGKPMKGHELVYTYTDEENIDFTFELTPAEGNFKDVDFKDMFNTTGIKITFPNASYISYYKKASLTDPEGTVIYAQYPATNFKNTITYKFGSAKTVWADLKTGAYVLTIPAHSLYVDDAAAESNGDPGNWPEKDETFTFYVDSITGVVLVGIEAADSYDVYTMDGKVVKLNAAPAEMLDLEPGLYIVNGKKVFVRK